MFLNDFDFVQYFFKKCTEKKVNCILIIKATHTHTQTTLDVRQDDKWEKINIIDVEEKKEKIKNQANRC